MEDYELDPFAIPPGVAEWIRRRTGDDAAWHTNLHPNDREAMQWLVTQAEVLRANIRAWKQAADCTIQRIVVIPSEKVPVLATPAEIAECLPEAEGGVQ